MKSLLSAVMMTLFVVTGCVTTNTAPPAPQAERLSEQVARSTLQRAQEAYDAGDYGKAIATLKSGGIGLFEAAPPATRLAAMKLEAFSYCLNNQEPECRAQFVRLLQVFPSFELSVAERTHPRWGPAFEAARKTTKR